MRHFLGVAAVLFASGALAQSATTVDRAKSDLDSCLRANADLELAKTDGAAAAAKAALGKCDTEVGKLDRAMARASRDAGKTVTQNKEATDAAHQAILAGVEAFIAGNLQ